MKQFNIDNGIKIYTIMVDDENADLVCKLEKRCIKYDGIVSPVCNCWSWDPLTYKTDYVYLANIIMDTPWHVTHLDGNRFNLCKDNLVSYIPPESLDDLAIYSDEENAKIRREFEHQKTFHHNEYNRLRKNLKISYMDKNEIIGGSPLTLKEAKEQNGYMVLNGITYVLMHTGYHQGKENGEDIYIAYAKTMDRWGNNDDNDIVEIRMDRFRNLYYTDVGFTGIRKIMTIMT